MKKGVWITSGYLIILLIAMVINALTASGQVGQRLSSYMDQEGLKPVITQMNADEVLGKYKYNGKPFMEYVSKMHYDGASGGGMSAYGEHFGFQNDFRAGKREDESWATYTNTVYFDIMLEGLELPCGISFGETFSEVLRKLNVTKNPEKNFVPDPSDETVMTLFSEEGATLKVSDMRNESGKFGYVLEYARTYTSDHRKGRDTLVTQSMMLAFDKESGQFSRFLLLVTEEYPMNP